MWAFIACVGLCQAIESERDICICRYKCPKQCAKLSKIENSANVSEELLPFKTKRMRIGFSSSDGVSIAFDVSQLAGCAVSLYSLSEDYGVDVEIDFSTQTNGQTASIDLTLDNITAHFVNMEDIGVNELWFRSIVVLSSAIRFEPDITTVLKTWYAKGESDQLSQFDELYIQDGFDVQLNISLWDDSYTTVALSDHQMLIRGLDRMQVRFENQMNVIVEGGSCHLACEDNIAYSDIPKVNFLGMTHLLFQNMPSNQVSSPCTVTGNGSTSVTVVGENVPFSFDVAGSLAILLDAQTVAFGSIVAESI